MSCAAASPGACYPRISCYRRRCIAGSRGFATTVPGDDQPSPGVARPRTDWSRSQPLGCGNRQPEHQTTEAGGTRGYDGGKKIKGRKRHALVDTDGRALKLQAHSAAIQDRDGAGPLLLASRARWPFVALAYADGGYAGPRVAKASCIRIEVVRKSDNQVGFAVIARRWVIERFFAWINRNRRLAMDFKATIESVEAFLHAASGMLLL